MHDAVVAAPTGATRRITGALLKLTDTMAAGLLAADLAVVIYSVLARSLFTAPVEWADDVARGLMVASSFFGAA
jgi:TRAP-type C4-dicarboxylate transport system permease small subunit